MITRFPFSSQLHTFFSCNFFEQPAKHKPPAKYKPQHQKKRKLPHMQQLELQDVKPQQPSFFKQLDEQQQIAVSAAPTGATIVHAGPGSGKTRVVTYRIAYLMEQFKFKAQNIVAVTFTNKVLVPLESCYLFLIHTSHTSHMPHTTHLTPHTPHHTRLQRK